MERESERERLMKNKQSMNAAAEHHQHPLYVVFIYLHSSVFSGDLYFICVNKRRAERTRNT